MGGAKSSTRRPKGTGGLHRRADGVWIAQVWLPDGSLYQRGRKRYGDARAELRKIQEQLADGILPNAGTITVAEWMERWVEEIAGPRLKPRRVVTY